MHLEFNYCRCLIEELLIYIPTCAYDAVLLGFPLRLLSPCSSRTSPTDRRHQANAEAWARRRPEVCAPDRCEGRLLTLKILEYQSVTEKMEHILYYINFEIKSNVSNGTWWNKTSILVKHNVKKCLNAEHLLTFFQQRSFDSPPCW